jgi:hypothetical protein
VRTALPQPVDACYWFPIKRIIFARQTRRRAPDEMGGLRIWSTVTESHFGGSYQVTVPPGGILGRTFGGKGACGVKGLRSMRCETNIHSRARRGSNQWMIRSRGFTLIISSQAGLARGYTHKVCRLFRPKCYRRENYSHEKRGRSNYPQEWWHWSYGDRYWAFQTSAEVTLYGPQ